MGTELDITQELASICVALTETAAITQVIHDEIRNPEFLIRYDIILSKVVDCVSIVALNLRPFISLGSETALVESFDGLHANYTESYLKEISKPRIYSDEAYEEYVLLRLQKEVKTTFPLLKRTFERLDKFIDKWITNDAWLAMSIDNMFKRLQTLFNEIAAFKAKDPEGAFAIHSQAFNAFKPYFALIGQISEHLHDELKPVAISQVN